MSKEYGTVYQMTNVVNGKKYVGQALTSDTNDWHVRCWHELNRPHNPHYKRAVEKYGKHNFISQSLDTATSKEELDAKEIHWISTLNTTNPAYGYNKTDGGYSGRPTDDVKQQISKTLTEWYSSHTIDSSTIHKLSQAGKKSQLLKTPTRLHNDIQRMKQCANDRKGKPAHNRKQWIFISPHGIEHLVNDFDSFCREHNLNRSNMHSTATGTRKHNKGWRCTSLP